MLGKSRSLQSCNHCSSRFAQMISYGNHRFPSKLFVVEGTDGSGKSTQLALLYQWLKAEGLPGVLF